MDRFPFGLVVLLMLLVVFALAAIKLAQEKSLEVTPTPSAAAAPKEEKENRTRDEWFWRAYIVAKDNRHDTDKVQGEMARIYAMIVNPIGDQAGLTKEQRAAAVAAMAEGWAEGAIRR